MNPGKALEAPFCKQVSDVQLVILPSRSALQYCV